MKHIISYNIHTQVQKLPIVNSIQRNIKFTIEMLRDYKIIDTLGDTLISLYSLLIWKQFNSIVTYKSIDSTF